MAHKNQCAFMHKKMKIGIDLQLFGSIMYHRFAHLEWYASQPGNEGKR